MPTFERFERKSRPTSPEPIVGLQKRGTLSMNAAAFNFLDATGAEKDEQERLHVELLFDSAEKIIGLRAVPPGRSTYPVRKQPNSESYLLTGRAFTVYHGIPTEETRQYAAKDFGDGVLGFSLVEDEIKG